MKTLYIHAGLPKNGSSALQVFFAKNREQLLEEGIDYFQLGEFEQAKKGEITSGNAALFSRSLLPADHPARYPVGGSYEETMAAVLKSDKEIGLLSSEFFALTPHGLLMKWKADLAQRGIVLKYVYYTRRQDQFLMSSYMQAVKRHGHSGGANRFILDTYKDRPFLYYFDYTKGLEKILGKGNVLPLIYESSKEHEKGLIGHFLTAVLGKCPKWVTVDSVVNTSPSPLEIKLMLMANKYSPRMQFSDFIVADSVIAKRSGKYQSHNIVSNEVVQEIKEHFSEQNEKFEQEYGDGNIFPREYSKEYIDLDNLAFTPEEVMDVVTGFLVRFDRRLTNLEMRR